MTRETKQAIMFDAGPYTAARKIANNTIEYRRENGDRVIRLHHTDIITFRANGAITLSSGGWRTVTTKDRLNEHLPHLAVWSEKGIWYLDQRCGSKGIHVFADGMTIKPDGTVV